MKRIPLAFALAAFAAASAQPTPQEILANNLKAIGGADAHKKISARRSEGTIRLALLGADAPVTILAKAPNKQASAIAMPGLGLMQEGYDGTTAWSKNALTGVKVKTGPELETARSEARFYRDVELATRHADWSLAGETSVGGAKAYRLVGRSADGKRSTAYHFDARTWLLTQIEETRSTALGPMAFVTRLSDYRAVGSAKFPFQIELIEPAQAAFTLKLKTIKTDVVIDDKEFAKP